MKDEEFLDKWIPKIVPFISALVWGLIILFVVIKVF